MATDALSRAMGWGPAGAYNPANTPAAPTPDPNAAMNQALSQINAEQLAAQQAQIAATNQAYQAQAASQAADLGLQQQQLVGNEQYQISQLLPKLTNLASARDYSNAQLAYQQPFQKAGLEDRLGTHGLLQSGVALGAVNRLNTGIAQKEATNAFNTNQQQDAISRQIQALQSQTAGQVAGLAARQKALNVPPAGAPTTGGAV